MHMYRRVLWGSRIQQDPPTVLYSEVMGDERALLKWLEKIVRNHALGIALMV